jgi:hypothetical protein
VYYGRLAIEKYSISEAGLKNRVSPSPPWAGVILLGGAQQQQQKSAAAAAAAR